MKPILVLLSFLIVVSFRPGDTSCTKGDERTFTASTPADPVVRSFLDISLTDSVDFIRWKLVLLENSYRLQCNYGIGKPNTNGFIQGGKKIELSGEIEKGKNYYQLKNGTLRLKIVELNASLLHLVDTGNNLLVGNGGWSYTLNSTSPVISDEINMYSKKTALTDSMVFEGRTPCNVPGVVDPGTTCYKLKWKIILYAAKGKNEPGTYKVLGTVWRKENGQTGNWSIVIGKNDRVIYRLNNEKENVVLYLLKAGENILLFSDAYGNLLTGNEDFSYTLNRR